MKMLAGTAIFLAITIGAAFAIDATLVTMENIREDLVPSQICVELSTPVNSTKVARVSTQEIPIIGLGAEGTNTLCAMGQDGADFLRLDEELMFEVGSDRKCVNFTACVDGIVEFAEFLNILLSSQDFTIAQSVYTVNIIDLDTITITFAQSVYSVDEESSTVSLCAVSITGITKRSVAFGFQTQNGTAADDGANQDFLPATIALQFTETTLGVPQCRNITILSDQLIEADEFFTVTLETQDSIVIVNGTAQVIIIDDEGATLTLDSDSAQTPEGDSGTTSVDVCISITDPLSNVERDIAILLTTVPDSATQTNLDYVAMNNERVLIPRGTQSACWPVTINGDQIREPDETFQVEITPEDSDDTLSGGTTFTVTILDDGDMLAQCRELDDPQNGNVSVSQSNPSSVNIEDSAASYTCDSGYELSMTETRTCGSDGLWSGSDPTCNPVDCGNPSVPQNGNVFVAQTTFMSLASYVCDPGFTISMPTRTCMADTMWTQPDPTCDRVDCGVLGDPANGNVDVNSTLFESQAEYSCNEGFERIGASTRTCADNGVWTPLEPTCPPVDCGALEDPPNGMVDFTLTTFDEIATYTCNPTFFLAGDSSRTCQSSAVWSGVEPMCITCPQLDDPENGNVVIAPAGESSVATYTCNTGYDLVGDSNRTCQDNGEWTNTEPSCQVVTCPQLPDPTNGTVSSADTNFNSMATYVCNEGFTLNGSSSRTCQEDGEWSNSAPTCDIVMCVVLSPPANGNITFPGGAVFNQEAMYSCMEGFELEGTSTRTCQADASWTDSEPTCEVVCPDLENPENGTVTLSGRRVDDTASYTCSQDYSLSGVELRTCQQNGAWDGTDPTCELTQATPTSVGVNTIPPDNTETVIAVAVSVSIGLLLLIGIVGAIMLFGCVIRKKKIHKKYVLPYRAYIYANRANESATEELATPERATSERVTSNDYEIRQWERDTRLHALEAVDALNKEDFAPGHNDVSTPL